MVNRMNNIYVPKPSINPQRPVQPQRSVDGGSFQDILNQQINQSKEIKISKHAEERLQSRNINLTNEQMDRVQKAVEKAESKGVKESLVMVDDIALVVSIKNRTVITAVDSNELKDNVFTNIDGAVII